MATSDQSELFDVRAWVAAPELRQREVLDAIVALLGPGFEVVYGDPDPRPRAAQTLEAFELPSLQGGLRIEHADTGVLFCFVPGGATSFGLSDQELALFDQPELIDEPAAPDVDDVRELHRQAPFMRGAQGRPLWRSVAPFLMAEAPLDWARLVALGLADLEASGEPERIGVARAERAYALAAPLRLPTELEWEHACRAGTRSPFPFGEAPPTELGDPLHPLGFAALGHFPEATDDPWRRHLEAGIAAPAPAGERSIIGVVRGGAALTLPWRAGSGGWLRLLSAWRATWLCAREGAAVRPVIGLPWWEAPPEGAAPRRPVPAWRVARRTTDPIGRMWSPDTAVREAARAELVRTTSGFGIWTGQAAAALPWLFDLAAQELCPERQRVLTLTADLIAGDHAATVATGLDRALPHIAEVASDAAARACRQALFEKLPRVAALVSDIDAGVRSAAALVVTLLPEGEAAARGPLTAALAKETVPEVRASLALGLGRLDRFARRAPSKAWFANASPLVAGAARLAALAADSRALADESGPLAPEHEAALAALVRTSADPELFPWHRARLAPLVARYLADCLPDGGIIAGLLLARLVREAGIGDDPRLAGWAEGAVNVGLGGAWRRRVDALEPRQWQIVADLSRRDFGEIAPAWRAAGLPTEMGARRTLVVRHRGRL